MLNRITNRFSAGLSLSIVGAIALVTGFACAQAAPQTAALTTKWKDATLHEIKVKTLDGKDANLAEYAGKVTLVVNVASQCGFTSQYAGLQKVYDKYKDRGLVILAFPSGDFGGQEFNDPKEIKEFCALDETTKELLMNAMAEYNLSARAYDRILKVSRTIADLAGVESINSDHVSEAIQYRSLDRQVWG